MTIPTFFFCLSSKAHVCFSIHCNPFRGLFLLHLSLLSICIIFWLHKTNLKLLCQKLLIQFTLVHCCKAWRLLPDFCRRLLLGDMSWCHSCQKDMRVGSHVWPHFVCLEPFMTFMMFYLGGSAE